MHKLQVKKIRKKLVVGIDIGSDYSGYAFSVSSRNWTNKKKILTFSWGNGYKQSPKTASVVLFDSQKRLNSFGHKAEEKYCSLMRDGNHTKWYLFRGFKKALYREENLSLSMILKDVTGKEMLALTVFSTVIQYMMDHILIYFSDQVADVRKENIRWAICVPTQWNDAAKQFIRIAAEKAGISGKQLSLVYESDAAALYCRHQYPALFDVSSAGSTYLLLDCGGGSIDITVHQVQRCGKLREVYPASGGEWGGSKVNETFFDFLSEIYGCDIKKRVTSEELFNLEWEFESLKEHTEPCYLSECNELTGFSFNLPGSLKRSSGPPFKNGYIVSVKGGKLRIDLNTMSDLFKETLNSIIDHLRLVMNDPHIHGLQKIFMVGGFSECALLQSCIRREFPFIDVITPPDTSSAVAKGSVMFVHNPEIIKTWASPRTYGIRKQSNFIHGLHDLEKMAVVDGHEKCLDLFDVYIQRDETLEYNQTQEYKTYRPIKSGQTRMCLHVYASTNRSPMYTTDPGCTNLGHIIVQMPDTNSGRDRRVHVKMMFGRAELKVKAIDETTGKKYTASFDFLNA